MTELVALKAGDRVGRYVIEREIGRGGMGIVYLATSPKGFRRAIKTLVFGGKLAAQLVDRFRREILLLASIEHAHVVRFYEAGKLEAPSGTTMWIALEYLEGQTLRELIAQHPTGMDPETVARWCFHIAQGVAAAHKLGVVHRDLKPENAALSGEIVKVYDLGIAKWGGAANPTADNLRIGTLAYMAPEQIDASVGPIDARTDIHAIGLMLHELATGRNPLCPFDELLTPMEVQGRILAYDPPPLAQTKPGFPADLGAIADRCVQKDPSARFQTMAELADALDDVLARLRAERHSVALADLGVDAGAAHAARRAKSSSDATPPPVVQGARGGFKPSQPRTQRLDMAGEDVQQWVAEARAQREARGEASPLLDAALARGAPAAPTGPLPTGFGASTEIAAAPGPIAGSAGAARAGSAGSADGGFAPGAPHGAPQAPEPRAALGASTGGAFATGSAGSPSAGTSAVPSTERRVPMGMVAAVVMVAAALGVATVFGVRTLRAPGDAEPGGTSPSASPPVSASASVAAPPSASAIAEAPEGAGGAATERPADEELEAAASATATPAPPVAPPPVGSPPVTAPPVRPPAPRWPPPPPPPAKKADVVIVD